MPEQQHLEDEKASLQQQQQQEEEEEEKESNSKKGYYTKRPGLQETDDDDGGYVIDKPKKKVSSVTAKPTTMKMIMDDGEKIEKKDDVDDVLVKTKKISLASGVDDTITTTTTTTTTSKTESKVDGNHDVAVAASSDATSAPEYSTTTTADATTSTKIDSTTTKTKTKSHRASRRSNDYIDDDDDDDDIVITNTDSDLSDIQRPGAVDVPGVRRSTTTTTTTPAEEETKQEERNDDDDQHLVVAELAPEIIQVTAIPMDDDDDDANNSAQDNNANNENKTKGSEEQQTRRTICVVGFVVVVAVAIIAGLTVGLSSSKKSNDDENNNASPSSNTEKIDDNNSNNTMIIVSSESPSPTSSSPQPTTTTTTTTTTPPTVLSNDIYEIDPAFQGYKQFWFCTETKEENSLNPDLYFCIHLFDPLLRQERRPGGYPYFFYDTNLQCQCKQSLSSANTNSSSSLDNNNNNNNSNEHSLLPPSSSSSSLLFTNENCPICHVYFAFQDTIRLCLWAYFTNVTTTTTTGNSDTDDDELLFQFQYDCSSIYWKQLANAVDKNCVGVDENGDCFNLDNVPVPPPPASLPPSDIATSRTIFESTDFNCLDERTSNATAIFAPIRGRFQCPSDWGIPYPSTTIQTLLACTTSDGYYLGADCNCIIFLGQLSFDMTCSSCTVLPNGNSNSTLRLSYDCSNRFEGDCIGYDSDGRCIDSNDIEPVCTYFDEESCAEKALELGLFLGGVGFAYSGNYITKGCQYYKSDHPLYANHAYFGTGASSLKEMEATPTEGNYRLTCDTIIENPPTQKVCEIFNPKDCGIAATAAGLSVGNEAQGFEFCGYGTSIVGCYFEPPYADPVRSNAAYFCEYYQATNYDMLSLPSGIAQRFLCNVTNNNKTNTTIT